MECCPCDDEWIEKKMLIRLTAVYGVFEAELWIQTERVIQKGCAGHRHE